MYPTVYHFCINTYMLRVKIEVKFQFIYVQVPQPLFRLVTSGGLSFHPQGGVFE